MLNLSGSSGLPLCISGIARSTSIPFPKQMADHDRRRKDVIKKLRLRSHGGETPSATEMREALSDLLRDSIPLPRAAKAA